MQTLEDGRNEENAHREPHHKEEHEQKHRLHHFLARHAFVDGYRRQHHHQHHGKEVFHHKHGENPWHKLMLTQVQVVECLDNNGG